MASAARRIRARALVGTVTALLFAVTLGAMGTPAVAATDPQLSTYAKAVLADGATHYWRFDEAAGSTKSADATGRAQLNLGAGVTLGTAGAINGSTDTAATFDGTAAGTAVEPAVEAPTASYSAEYWIKTTASFGLVLSFANNPSGTSSQHARLGAVTPGSLTDGGWHQVAVTFSTAEGYRSYVDGLPTGTNPADLVAPAFQGSWRVGGDTVSPQSSPNFVGSVDDVSIYAKVLTDAQVRNHFVQSGRTPYVTPAPADAYGQAVYRDSPATFLRLNETSGPQLASTSANASSGRVEGGVQLGAASTVAPGTAATFNALDDRYGDLIVARGGAGPNVTTFSLELWVKSTDCGGLMYVTDSPGDSNPENIADEGGLGPDGRIGFNGLSTGPGYNDGQWHQVAVTGDPGGQRLYVDGALASSTTAAPEAPAVSGAWTFGQFGDPLGCAHGEFTGSLDEISTYAFTLSATQVATHYRASGAAVSPAPVPAFSTAVNAATLTTTAPAATGATYAWTFGDGATATGSTATHTYAKGGGYSVTLTTVSGGTTRTTTRTVGVPGPPTAGLARDTFTRSGTRWGTADTGGAWTDAGAKYFSTTGSKGLITLPAANTVAAATLASTSARSTTTTVDFSVNKLATGSGIYVSLVAQKNGTASYRLKARLMPDGTVRLITAVLRNGTESTLTETAVLGLRYRAGETYRLRFDQINGAYSELNGRVWRTTDAQPATAQVFTTYTLDNAGSASGSVGLQAYLATDAKNAPVVVTVDDFVSRVSPWQTVESP